ncbi:unnamed protein product [Lymnaea stagnalis]|uniref:Uncharacterized protein n=1 Tax=Lymnaea stagnalis TaxID=6523 RepID=A0AAV2IIE3_LYMST
MDLHPSPLNNHYHVREDVYLKQGSKMDIDENRSQVRSCRQPKIIFRMKRDPELKKQIRAENANSTNSNLQFKWEDDSDGDPGFSPPHRGACITPSRDHKAMGASSGGASCSSNVSATSKNIFETMGLKHSVSVEHNSEPIVPPSKVSPLKKVRKVRLKMIDTSLHFDLISPSASPPKSS